MFLSSSLLHSHPAKQAHCQSNKCAFCHQGLTEDAPHVRRSPTCHKRSRPHKTQLCCSKTTCSLLVSEGGTRKCASLCVADHCGPQLQRICVYVFCRYSAEEDGRRTGRGSLGNSAQRIVLVCLASFGSGLKPRQVLLLTNVS